MGSLLRRSSLVACGAAALLAAGTADAHVVAQPSFLAAGGTATISLSGPNERDEVMTGFRVRVPNELRIVSAHGPDGWQPEVREVEATWSGGRLPPEQEETFHVRLEAPTAPGPAMLETEQLYPGGESVSWRVPLTIVPAAEAPGTNLGWALVVAAGGLLLTTSIVVLAWRRRPRPLQER